MILFCPENDSTILGQLNVICVCHFLNIIV